MKKLTTIFLLCAGMLLSLAGCQEKPVTPDGKEGKLVEFAAVAGKPATRTAFSGEGTGTAGNLDWERIDWVKDDPILIWSDNAHVRNGGSGNAATYTIDVIKTSSDGKESRATLSDPNGTGLVYKDGGEHTFWGLYPASAISAAPTTNYDKLSFSIPADQTGTKSVDNDNITFAPDMDLAVMLAKVTGAKEGKQVDLRFYPAFTVFELTFAVDEKIEGIQSVFLYQVTLTSSSDLAGTVNAEIKEGIRTFEVSGGGSGNDAYAFISEGREYTTGASTYTFPSTGQGKTITFDLNGGVELKRGKELKMTIITLPENVNDLTIGMYMGEDGSDVRTGTLKVGGTGADKGKKLAFAACQKHNLRGVLLKPHDWEFSSITTQLQVLDWEPENIDADAEHFPQSTQISVSEKNNEKIYNAFDDFGMGGKNTPERQMWYFKPGQTITLFMKVMLPASGSWEFVPMGGTEDNPVEADLALFTIKNVSPAVGETPTNPDNLWGPIRETGSTDVNLEITYTGTDTENQHSLYFHTYVYSGANKTGTRFNIDSETQLYDRGRGYHTFFVNSPLYPND